MSQTVSPVPEEYDSVTPYLIVEGAERAIEHYREVFEAEEVMRLPMNGGIGHAELRIGKSIIMLADPCPDMGYHSASKFGGSPIWLCVYVEDADAAYNRAVKAGAEVIRKIDDQFYGDRSGTVRDPFGINWTISSRIEKLTLEEVKRRSAEFLANQSGD